MLIKTLIMQQLPFGQNMYYLDKGFVLIQIYLVNKCKIILMSIKIKHGRKD